MMKNALSITNGSEAHSAVRQTINDRFFHRITALTQVLSGVVLALLPLVSTQTLHATTHSWTGAAGDGMWSTPFNWANSAPPTAGESASVIVQFPIAGTRYTTNDIANLTLDQIQIAGDNYVIAGVGQGSNVTLRSAVGLSSTLFITGANALLTGFNFNLATNFIPNASVSVSAGDTATMRGRFIGPGGLIKRANGTFVLDGNAANTYAGTTEIQGGTLKLSQTGVAIPGDLIIGLPAISNLSVVELLAPNQIGDTAEVRVNFNGTFTPGVFTDTIGSIVLSNADLVAGPGLTLQGNFTSIGDNVLTGTVRLGGASRIFDVSGYLKADAFIENPMGTAGLTKTGPGILELRRANSYNGITAVNEGTLIVAHAKALGSTSAATEVNPGATLQITGSLAIAGEALYLGGSGVSTNGAFSALAGAASWSGPITLTSSSTIGVISAADQLTLSGAITGSGDVRKVGAGRLTLAGLNANTFAGKTRVWEGELRLAKSINLPAVGELEIARTNVDVAALCTLSASHQIADNARVTVGHRGQFRLAGFDEAVAGLVLDGGFVETESGLLTLLGDATATTWTEVDMLGNPGQAHLAEIHGRLSLGGATRTFQVGASGDSLGTLFLGAVVEDGAGTGGLRKTGPGQLYLFGANTYTGPTYLESGSVLVGSSKALGASTQGTIVSSGADLIIDGFFGNLSIPEPLTLIGAPSTNSIAKVTNPRGTNSWTGPITLGTSTTVGLFFANARLTFSGAISGPGQLIKIGNAELELSGPEANTFEGGLVASEGEVVFNKPPGVTTVRKSLQVGTAGQPPGNARAIWLSSHQIEVGASVLVNASGRLELNNQSEGIGALTLRGGAVAGTSGVLTLGGDVQAAGNSDSRIDCVLSLGGATRNLDVTESRLVLTKDVRDGGAPAGLRKTGMGDLVFDKAITTYSGQTEILLGNVELRGLSSLGNTDAGTLAYSGGRLILADATIGNESLTFEYKAGNWASPNWSCSGTNSWAGPLVLHQQTTVRCHFPDARLTLSGQISGNLNGVFLKEGQGVVRLAGTNNNTFSGETISYEGVLELAKTNGVAIAGPLTIGLTNTPWPYPAIARCHNHHQIGDTNLVTVHHNGLLDLNGFTDLIGGLELNDGRVKTDAGQLRLAGDVAVTGYGDIAGRLSLGDGTREFHVAENGLLHVTAAISGLDPAAGFTKTGAGDLWLLGTNTFGGETRLFGGDVYAQTPFAFGSTQSGTVISNYSRLHLSEKAHVTNEALQLIRGQLIGTVEKTNAWHGPITIGDYSWIECLGTNGLMLLDGVISGQGSLTLFGNILIYGSQPNTFAGEVRTIRGTVQLSKTNAAAIPANLTVGSEFENETAIVRLLRPDQIADNAAVHVLREFSYDASGTPHQLDLNGFKETVGSLDGAGDVDFDGSTFMVGVANTSTTFAGRFFGDAPASFIKLGTGALSLDGTHSFNGLTHVEAGILLVNGSLAGSSVEINSGAALGGRGTTGDVTSNGGRVIPGNNLDSPAFGRLKTGTISFKTGSNYRCELGGTNAGTNHDQIEVTGFLNIANSILSVQPFGLGAIGNQYTVIKVAGGAAPFGQFAGLPEGTTFTATPGRTYRITYAGGPSGRDVVLTQLAVPQPAQMSGVTPSGNGTMKVTGTGTPGLGYEIFATTNLVTATWLSLGSATAGTQNGVLEFIDVDAANFPMRFYRFAVP